MTEPAPLVPQGVRVQLGHAAVQRLAEQSGVDLLHVKGYALHPSVAWEGRVGSDVDVLVRPDQVQAFLDILRDAGWQLATGFEAGSPFGHAATLKHDLWGYLDLHRLYPGITLDPGEAFDILWHDRGERRIAGVTCTVPSVPAQVLLLVLHAARAGRNRRAQRDVDHAWGAAPAARRQEVRDLVWRLGAEVAFAAGIGELNRYRGRPGYLLWKVSSQGGTRLEEWLARILAARSATAGIRLVLRAPLVNVEHLTELWGRRPTRAEIVTEFFARPIRGVREEIRVWRGPRGGAR